MRARGKHLLASVAVAACACAVVSPPAEASVEIGTDQIKVAGDGASAVIDRDPFRMSFGGEGGDVLSEVDNSEPAVFPLLPSPDPVPLGSDVVDGPSLYSPLSFTVGTAVSLDYPATLYVGNKLFGAQTSLTFSPRAVVEAAKAGRGVEMVVSTNDPTGRELIVNVAPDGAGSIQVSARVTPDAGVASISDSFQSTGGEAFRGFGGRHNGIDQRGNDFYNWVQQQNVGAGALDPAVEPLPGTGGDQYLFPNGPAGAFYV